MANHSVSSSVYSDTHFSLLGLPQRFAVDLDALERAYKNVQAQVHPDRFAAAPAAQRRVAMQWAARANEAYTVLRTPLKRAAYLCELRGVAIEAESNTAMPREFLMQQMQWREALDEATHPWDASKVQALRTQLTQAQDALAQQVATAIDEQNDMAQAAARVRQWMFVERFAQDVLRALHAAEDAASSHLKSA